MAEYRTSKTAPFDSKTKTFTEYALPEYTFPYQADFDKNGEIWASIMSTDRVVRLDPKTGHAVQYLIPSDTNMRAVFVDNSTTPVTFWVGSNGSAPTGRANARPMTGSAPSRRMKPPNWKMR